MPPDGGNGSPVARHPLTDDPAGPSTPKQKSLEEERGTPTRGGNAKGKQPVYQRGLGGGGGNAIPEDAQSANGFDYAETPQVEQAREFRYPNPRLDRERRRDRRPGRSRRASERSLRSKTSTGEQEVKLTELATPSPTPRASARPVRRQGTRGEQGESLQEQDESLSEQEEHLTELAAPPPIRRAGDASGRHHARASLEAGLGRREYADGDKPSASGARTSPFATQLYTVSYLILFSILGTLARLGIQWLTFYPGAPVSLGVLWANVAGSLVMGFLSEDRRLFRVPHSGARHAAEARGRSDDKAARAAHARAKKAVPLYVGLTTGFCGSLTSFSSFMRDVFLALSNDLPAPPPTSSTVPRSGGYSVMALLAVVILTVALSLGALRLGAHLALALDPLTPALPPAALRRSLDRAAVPLAAGAWLAALLLCILPPDRPGGPAARDGGWARETWRGQALFAVALAPPGCLLRFHAARRLNGIAAAFPLGTFAANVFGTAVLGMAFDLQHVRLAGTAAVGAGRVGCQVLQGVMDGFCGCLTTVSTWVAELSGLRPRHAWVYGAVSVGASLALLLVVMGSVRWTVGWEAPACVT